MPRPSGGIYGTSVQIRSAAMNGFPVVGTRGHVDQPHTESISTAKFRPQINPRKIQHPGAIWISPSSAQRDVERWTVSWKLKRCQYGRQVGFLDWKLTSLAGDGRLRIDVWALMCQEVFADNHFFLDSPPQKKSRGLVGCPLPYSGILVMPDFVSTLRLSELISIVGFWFLLR